MSQFIHSYANAIAGHTRLCDFEQRLADPVAVADADIAVGQSVHSEVFAKLPECEIAPLQFALPVAIRIHLVDEHSAPSRAKITR